MSVVAILMGRKGSSGFPGKNTTPVLGKPMVSYPLMAASKSELIDDIYVTTDCHDIKRISAEYQAKIIDRPAELCSNTALGDHVYEHAHETIVNTRKADGAEPANIYVLLMANAVTITTELIDDGIRVLQEQKEVDSAVSVSSYNMWSPLRARKIGNDGLLHPFVPFETFGDPKTLNCDRDSQGDVWFADMGVSVIRASNLDHLEDGLLPQKWMGQNIYPLKQWGGLDVDYDWQVPQIEAWIKAHQKKTD